MRVLTLGTPSRVASLRAPESLDQLAQLLGPTCQGRRPPHYPLAPPHTARAFACQPVATQRSRAAMAQCSHCEHWSPQLAPVGGLNSPYLRQQAAQTLLCPLWGWTLTPPSAPPSTFARPQAEPPLSPTLPTGLCLNALGFPLCPLEDSLCWSIPGLGGTPPSQNNVQAMAKARGLSSGHASLCPPASHACSFHRPAEKACRKPRRRCGCPAAERSIPSRSRGQAPALLQGAPPNPAAVWR